MVKGPLSAQLRAHFRWLGDGSDGWRFADRAGWLRSSTIVAEIGGALAELGDVAGVDIVLAPETSGLPLGALAAAAGGVGFVGAEKRRRDLADSDAWVTASTGIDYQDRNQEFFVRRSLVEGATVAIVDDWTETGGTIAALHRLVERAGGSVRSTSVVVDALDQNAVRQKYRVRSLLHLRELRER